VDERGDGVSVQPAKSRRRKRKRVAEPIALNVLTRSGLRVSDRAFERLCALNPELCLERSAKKELIVMTPAGADSSGREATINAQLWIWNHARSSGRVFSPSVGFTLPNGAIRGPDASWISQARWDALSVEDRQRFSHVSPEFVVELRSPSNRINIVRKKMREYMEQGSLLGWLIDPVTGLVEIYRPGRAVEVLVKPVSLSGEDVLPGFVLDLKGVLFD
jgi:Uma2 family endonuclease